ncbi:MAG: hypothetical protein WBV06_08045, partial [Acidimicrobiia bacterium]
MNAVDRRAAPHQFDIDLMADAADPTWCPTRRHLWQVQPEDGSWGLQEWVCFSTPVYNALTPARRSR